MQLLRKDPVQELFLAIELIKSGFLNGDGYETVLKNLSLSRYGSISMIAEMVLGDISKGIPISESIEDRTRKRSESIRSLFNALGREDREESSYELLTKSVIEALEDDTNKILQKVESFFNISLFLVFVPFLIMVIDYMHSIGLGDMFAMVSVLRTLESTILLISGAIFVYSAVRMRL